MRLRSVRLLVLPLVALLVAGGLSAAQAYTHAIPTSLRATEVSSTSITLDWNDVPRAELYRVQLATKSSMSGATYHRFDESEGTISGLKKDTTYWFRVAVIDPDSGAKLSDYTGKSYPSARTAAGAASGGWEFAIPGNLRAVDQGPTSLALDWNSVEGAPLYRVQYSTSSSMSGAKYASFSSSDGVLTGLKKTTTYWFRVAVVEAGNGAKLSDYTAKPYPSAKTVNGPSYPGGYAYPVPANLRSTAQTATTADLDWDDVSGIGHYRVQYSTSSSMSGAKYATFTESNGRLEGLKASTRYYIRVAAVSASGAKLSDYTQKTYPSVTTKAPTAANDVKVGSFNIADVSGDARLRNAQQTWAERRGAVADDITGADLEVVGLQEASPYSSYRSQTPGGANQQESLLSALRESDDAWRLIPREVTSSSTIAYRSDRFNLEDSGFVLYDEQSGSNRYLAWAILEVKETGKEFLVTSTHLNSTSESIRESQWKQLITEVNALQGNRPVIAVGDFNTTKFKDLAKTMFPAMKNAGFGDVLNQEYQVNPPRNPRAETIVNGYFNSFNDFKRDLDGDSKCYCTAQSKVGNVLDQIFATNSLRVKRYEQVLDVDAKFDLVGVIPSDHQLVTATIVVG